MDAQGRAGLRHARGEARAALAGRAADPARLAGGARPAVERVEAPVVRGPAGEAERGAGGREAGLLAVIEVAALARRGARAAVDRSPAGAPVARHPAVVAQLLAGLRRALEHGADVRRDGPALLAGRAARAVDVVPVAIRGDAAVEPLLRAGLRHAVAAARRALPLVLVVLALEVDAAPPLELVDAVAWPPPAPPLPAGCSMTVPQPEAAAAAKNNTKPWTTRCIARGYAGSGRAAGAPLVRSARNGSRGRGGLRGASIGRLIRPGVEESSEQPLSFHVARRRRRRRAGARRLLVPPRRRGPGARRGVASSHGRGAAPAAGAGSGARRSLRPPPGKACSTRCRRPSPRARRTSAASS